MEKGRTSRHVRGYVFITKHDHPRANKDGYVFEHIVVVEKAIGKFIPEKAVIHHIDGNPSNNSIGNIVLCENQAYHLFLHLRIRAIRACGNPSWRICKHCKEYDAPENIIVYKGRAGHHKKCDNEYQNKIYAMRKIKGP